MDEILTLAVGYIVQFCFWDEDFTTGKQGGWEREKKTCTEISATFLIQFLLTGLLSGQWIDNTEWRILMLHKDVTGN